MKVLQKKPLVVLTTAYSESALEGYELDVADYLLKPITFERFLRAVDRVTQRLEGKQTPTVERVVQDAGSQFMFVKDGTKLVKVQLSDILYIEGLKDYVTIHTKQQKITSLQRMKALEEQLPSDLFIRIHNSYIVSLKSIEVVHKGDVQVGGNLLPIGETFKKSFREFIEKNQM